METTSIPDYPRGVTFEQVWALLQEVGQKQKESAELQKENAEFQKEIDEMQKENAEQQKENAKQQKENAKRQEENAEQQKRTDELIKRTDKQIKKTARQMGYLSNRFGEMAEHLVKPGIYQRFNELGYHFSERTNGSLAIDGEDGKTKAEIDLLLQNGDTIMAVEIKATPRIKHIAEHIKRLEILRDHRRKLNERQNVIDNRQVEGAIAGAIFDAEVKKATIDAGLYVIEQSGDTMKINVPDGFVPRRW